MNDFDLARADFQKVLQLYPSNKAAKTQLAVCQQRTRQQLAREKKLYANMFERLAEEESKTKVAAGDHPTDTEMKDQQN
ncbi:hypothetical protein NL503_28290, partial [Klebsiella pneumoniae]|nr:hypothetical protein [Klebsiella pneumoniae]